jgi:hypothetical protein
VNMVRRTQTSDGHGKSSLALVLGGESRAPPPFRSDITHPGPAEVAISRPGLGAMVLEYFLRFLVVALGIWLGLGVADFIGRIAGWIPC